MGFNQVLKQVQEAGEDREWYPTTEEQIEAVFNHLTSKEPGRYSLLDVGAGDGKVLRRLREYGKAHEAELAGVRGCGDPTLPISCYAIEQSMTLIQAMPEDVFIIGTDFWQQSFIDKQVDVIFSNPPYSEYAQWAAKLIKEAASKVMYLILPSRWSDNAAIANALKAREAFVEVVGSFDYLEAEDRKARAKVDVIFISFIGDLEEHYYFNRYHRLSDGHRARVDPFDLWFDEHFEGFLSKDTPFDSRVPDESERMKARLDNELVTGSDMIQALETLYQRDLEHLIQLYQSLAKVDLELLREMAVSIESIKKGLKLKIDGLKNKYWLELFENMDKITSKLTSGSRKKLLDKLTAHTNLDFNASNAYSVLIWVIKQANLYFDEQLVDIYSGMIDEANVSLYKSNDRLFRRDDWRYIRFEDHANRPTHFKLETRIVLHRHKALSSSYRLYCEAADFVNNLATIGNNLGFPCSERARDFTWERSKKVTFHYARNNKREVLFEVKAFDNGNLHIKFASDFMAALNVEHGRLKGWVRSAQEAAVELDLPQEQAAQFFGANLSLGADSLQHFLPAPAEAA